MGFKDKETVEVTYNGIGFSGLLTILFIGLKLTGHIDWDWIWVFSPLWIGFVLFFGVILFFAIGAMSVAMIISAFDSMFNRKK